MFARSKAFTITEMLVAIAMSVILMISLFALYESTQKIFFNTSSISGAEENAYSAYGAMQTFFDRWGSGVPSNSNNSSGYPPPSPDYVSISSGNPCDSITFYGDLYGFGMVQSISNGNANLISCRLSNDGYYYLVRNGKFYYSNSSNSTPDVFTINISPNNAGCLSTTNANASISSATIYDKTTGITMSLTTGDMLYSIPYKITFFCQSNTNDNNNNWLFVKTTNEYTNISHTHSIVPVQSVSFNAYPQDCISTNTCNMIEATIGVNSINSNASGQTSSITFSFYFYK